MFIQILPSGKKVRSLYMRIIVAPVKKDPYYREPTKIELDKAFLLEDDAKQILYENIRTKNFGFEFNHSSYVIDITKYIVETDTFIIACELVEE